MPVGREEADEDFEARVKSAISLVHLHSDAPEGEKLARPYKQTTLGPEDCAVLHWPGEQLFVWTGNAAPGGRKLLAFQLAARLQTEGEKVGVEAAPQFAEPPVFRMHFQAWVASTGTP